MTTERKVVIITGASQGIGAELVKAYRALDYRVVGVSRTIKPSGDPDYLTIAGDLGDAATSRRTVGEALSRFGRIDTLINNAGVFIAAPFTAYSIEQYEQVVSTNLNGFYFITQAVISAMEKQGFGHVVSVTTSLVDHPSAKVPSVLASLSKGGVAAATKSLAVEYAARGIRVNAVSPGIIKTPMHPLETHEFLAALHPVKRMGEIEDVVNAILFLETASFVTGEILHVDGGQAAGY